MIWHFEKQKIQVRPALIGLCVLFCLIILFTGCSEIKSPTPQPYIGENAPPPKQEFRWSNGKMPKSFDPARAAAAPETDIVRAIYEGLTDIDSKTLKPVPALSTKWESTPDFKTWTFHLRKDAKWTNGEPVIAQDFIDSWKRLVELGDKVPQRNLLKNIVGMDSEDVLPVFAEEPNEELEKQEANKVTQQYLNNSNSANTAPNQSLPIQNKKAKNSPKFGIEAVSDFAVKVTLIHPDQDFPLLVAHPIFRPIYGNGEEFDAAGLDADIVTNGAFKIKSVGKDGISLEKSQVYWNKNTVLLESVRFVPTDSAENALAAYREGKVDAVTNANFQPLALKLLQPFKNEFHQSIHGALNFYEFNLVQKPFDDARVRKALAISIEREQLTENDLDGTTEPALTFLPLEEDENKLQQSVEKARKLLAQAGFPNGDNFPIIKLVINRNNVQQQIAKSISQMWLKNLNLKTEIIVKDQVEMQDILQTGDYSLVRRGVVLPTNNETSNMLVMFHETKIPFPKDEIEAPKEPKKEETAASNHILTEKTSESELNVTQPESSPDKNEIKPENKEISREPQTILTEDQALEQIPAIPLYFPTSYSLVKPYIHGFELNAFDINSLKNVQIDSTWQPTENNSTPGK